jgi:hypothetical protein
MILHRDRDFTAYVCGKRDRQRGVDKTCQNRQVNARKADAAILDRVLGQVLTPTFTEELLSEIQNKMVDTEDLDRTIANNYKLLFATVHLR